MSSLLCFKQMKQLKLPLQMEGNSADFSGEKTSFLLVSMLGELGGDFLLTLNHIKYWVYFVMCNV